MPSHKSGTAIYREFAHRGESEPPCYGCPHKWARFVEELMIKHPDWSEARCIQRAMVECYLPHQADRNRDPNPDAFCFIGDD